MERSGIEKNYLFFNIIQDVAIKIIYKEKFESDVGNIFLVINYFIYI